MEIWLVTAILIVTLVLLITDKAPVDLVAVGLMVSLAVAGILQPNEAVAGFASPAVITVGAMFLMSRGMIRTGAVGFIGQQVIAMARGKHRLALLMSLLIVAAASAFINNTAAVAILLPPVLGMARRIKTSPSKLLIPLSFASLFGGSCTLIGTSTNLVVQGMMADATAARPDLAESLRPMGLFEIGAVGIPCAVIGILYLIFFSNRILPERSDMLEEIGTSPREYMVEMKVSDDCEFAGMHVEEAGLRHLHGLERDVELRFAGEGYKQRGKGHAVTDAVVESLARRLRLGVVVVQRHQSRLDHGGKQAAHALLGLALDLAHPLPADPHLLPIAAEILVHQVIGERVVTGRYRRVGGKGGCVPHLLHRQSGN